MSITIDQLRAADQAAKEARAVAIKNPTPANRAAALAADAAQDRAWKTAAAENQALLDEFAARTDVMAQAIRQ